MQRNIEGYDFSVDKKTLVKPPSVHVIPSGGFCHNIF